MFTYYAHLLEVVGTHTHIPKPFEGTGGYSISQVSANRVLDFKRSVYNMLAGPKPAEAAPFYLNGKQ